MKNLKRLFLAILVVTILSCNGIKVTKNKLCGTDTLYIKINKLYHVVVPQLKSNGKYKEGYGVEIYNSHTLDTLFFQTDPNNPDTVLQIPADSGRKILKGMVL